MVVKPTAAIQNTLNRHEKRQNSNVWRPIPHVLLLLHNLPKWKVEAEVFRCLLTKIDDSGWNIILSPCSEKGEEKVHSFYVSFTGEMIGVEYLRSQSGNVLGVEELDKEIDEAFQDGLDIIDNDTEDIADLEDQTVTLAYESSDSGAEVNTS